MLALSFAEVCEMFVASETVATGTWPYKINGNTEIIIKYRSFRIVKPPTSIEENLCWLLKNSLADPMYREIAAIPKNYLPVSSAMHK
jgi:hypothetical protein